MSTTPINRIKSIPNFTQFFLCSNVTLGPCSPQINLFKVEEMFRQKIGRCSSILKIDFCHFYKQSFSEYSFDDTCRNLAKQILGCVDSKVIPPTSIIHPGLPYPGKNAKFFLWEDSWDRPSNCRIELRSANNASFIQSIRLSKYEKNSLGMFITFNSDEDAERIDSYLQSHGFPPMDLGSKSTKCYSVARILLIRKFFKILAENNDFPKESFEKMKSIIETWQ